MKGVAVREESTGLVHFSHNFLSPAADRVDGGLRMNRNALSHTRHIAAAFSVGLVLSLSTARADADETAAAPPATSAPAPEPPERTLPTAGKVLLYSFGGVTIVSAIVFGVSIAARESAVSRHNRFPTKDGFTDCTTPQDCADVASAREDADAWGSRAAVAGGIAIGAGISTALIGVFWEREAAPRPRVTPSVSASSSGASFALEGRF